MFLTVSGTRIARLTPVTLITIRSQDIYGLPLVNSKLLADNFAKAGFATYVPDYLNGEFDFMYRLPPVAHPTTNRRTSSAKPNRFQHDGMVHSPWWCACTVIAHLLYPYRAPAEDQTTPSLLAVIDGLKKFGVKNFAATGVCSLNIFTFILFLISRRSTASAACTPYDSHRITLWPSA